MKELIYVDKLDPLSHRKCFQMGFRIVKPDLGVFHERYVQAPVNNEI